MVQMEVKDEDSLKYFGLYHSQILRINNIVMDLINLTRMNHDTEAKSKIDFRTLIEDCISSYSYLENFQKINFVTEVDENLNYMSKWAIVNTILQNLIENSIKYARNNIQSYIAIDVTQEKDFIKIQVEDNGQGIRLTDHTKVFDMFFRANDHVQGTGLGLYILQRAVERLQGTVSFTSELHVGTVFTVLLPIEFAK
jgi:signal transduction histidine kinase